MKVELHLHTSRYSACAANTPEQMIRRMIRTGYGAVYITEHDAIWPLDELDELRASFPQISIFSGLERTLKAHHLLILGTDDREYLAMDSVAAVLDKAAGEGHLTVLAHPFRWKGGADMLHDGLLPDAIEGRTPNHDSRGGDLSLTLAGGLSLPVVNTGDVHALSFVNHYWIETDRPVVGVDDIRPIILAGEYRNFISI